MYSKTNTFAPLYNSQDEEKVKLKGEVHRLIAPRDQKHQSNFVEFRSLKIVYRRYAGLFFCVCVDANDNELAYLEAIHFFVEVLDSFFGNVCELDLVFNFYKVCFFLSLFFTPLLSPQPSAPKSIWFRCKKVLDEMRC